MKVSCTTFIFFWVSAIAALLVGVRLRYSRTT
jgi:hypothetical protein